MNPYEVFNCASIGSKHNRLTVIRRLPLGLGVDSPQVEFVPHLFQELINVPAMFGTDRASVRNPVEQVQLLDRDGVNLVQRVDDGDVASVLRFEHINHIVNGSVATDGNIGRRDLVFVHDGLDFLFKRRKYD